VAGEAFVRRQARDRGTRVLAKRSGAFARGDDGFGEGTGDF
jgi:hypothetical protein